MWLDLYNPNHPRHCQLCDFCVILGPWPACWMGSLSPPPLLHGRSSSDHPALPQALTCSGFCQSSTTCSYLYSPWNNSSILGTPLCAWLCSKHFMWILMESSEQILLSLFHDIMNEITKQSDGVACPSSCSWQPAGPGLALGSSSPEFWLEPLPFLPRCQHGGYFIDIITARVQG